MKNYYQILEIEEIGNFQQFQNEMSKLQNSLYKKMNRTKKPEKQVALKTKYDAVTEFLQVVKTQEQLLNYNIEIDEVVIEEFTLVDEEGVINAYLEHINQKTREAVEAKLKDYNREEKANNYGVAATIAEGLTNIDVNNMYYWTLLANAYNHNKQIKQAGYAFRKAMDCSNVQSQAYLFNSYAWYMVQNESNVNSINTVKKMINKYPKSQYLNNAYACLLKNNKREKEAIGIFCDIYTGQKDSHIVTNIDSALKTILNRSFEVDNNNNYIYYTEDDLNQVIELLDQVSQVSNSQFIDKEYQNIKLHRTQKLWRPLKYTKVLAGIIIVLIVLLDFSAISGGVSFIDFIILIVVTGLPIALIIWLLLKLKVSRLDYNQYVYKGVPSKADTVEKVVRTIFKIITWIIGAILAIIGFILTVCSSSNE